MHMTSQVDWGGDFEKPIDRRELAMNAVGVFQGRFWNRPE
jgi:hypothetical protein